MPTRTWLLLAASIVALVLALGAMKLTVPKMVRTPPTGDGPPPEEVRTALLVVHAGWRAGTDAAEQRGVRCPEGRLVDAEVDALRMILARAGFALYVVESDAIELADVARHALLVHHGGGVGRPLPPAEVDAIRAARAAGRSVLFLGDDVATSLAATPDLARAAGVEQVVGDGRAPATLRRADGRSSFAYQGDPDEGRLLPGLEVRLAGVDGAPVAWLADRVGVVQASVRASDLCPVSDELGRVELEAVVAELLTAITR